MTELCQIFVSILFTWRVTHLLHAEDGPWNLSLRLRQRVGQGIAGQALDCFNCLSLWVALPATCFVPLDMIHLGVAWPAISGGAILLQRASNPIASAIDAPPAIFAEGESEG